MDKLNFERARHNMVEQQIRTWDVFDERVLDLMLEVPREDFVPQALRSLAFNDMAVPLRHGEAMMQPKVEARMLQALNVHPADTILEIGTGSGYVTALLAGLGQHVFSVDLHADFVESAGTRLASHGIDDVTLDTGDAARGWGRRGTFDIIAVTGSLPELTGDIRKDLNIGGRMFAVIGREPVMEACLITRLGRDDWQKEALFETVVPPLANAPESHHFVL